jgi:hypothetical protein
VCETVKVTETIRCHGHPSITSRHPTTFEVTREEHLSRAGDCIIAVGADKGAADLSPAFRAALARNDAVLCTRLICGDQVAAITSQGSEGMLLSHPTDLVWRRSSFVCDRTIGIFSDRTARTLPRPLIVRLSEGDDLRVELTVTAGE